jgi:hypothetical protein
VKNKSPQPFRLRAFVLKARDVQPYGIAGGATGGTGAVMTGTGRPVVLSAQGIQMRLGLPSRAPPLAATVSDFIYPMDSF